VSHRWRRPAIHGLRLRFYPQQYRPVEGARQEEKGGQHSSRRRPQPFDTLEGWLILQTSANVLDDAFPSQLKKSITIKPENNLRERVEHLGELSSFADELVDSTDTVSTHFLQPVNGNLHVLVIERPGE
jgi:hypothetical protein